MTVCTCGLKRAWTITPDIPRSSCLPGHAMTDARQQARGFGSLDWNEVSISFRSGHIGTQDETTAQALLSLVLDTAVLGGHRRN
jgi:hypothetical protein